ncbi:MAG: patatin-like phospholipase family protein, partial [Betaproteobacteria bacterium]|nr:patatin-like phospholipase family protein [Betaproteobacteria bacterium]
MFAEYDLKTNAKRRQLLALFAVGTLQGCASTTTEPASAPKLSEPANLAKPAPAPWALALGGGAARGLAHVGVIEVLEREGLVPDFVVGTSAGALVGALWASGMDAAKLKSVALSFDQSSL